MSSQADLDILVDALAALPAYEDPLAPVYEALGREQQLTLHAIRRHTALLHAHVDEVHDQTAAIKTVIASCKQIPPTPAPALPLRF